MATSVSFS